MEPRQFVVSLILGIALFAIIIRLIQKGKMEISYCWLWLGIGIAAPLLVIRYDWLIRISALIGSETPTTTLFLFSILLLFLMNLQFSLIISSQRRKIKRLSQALAMQSEES